MNEEYEDDLTNEVPDLPENDDQQSEEEIDQNEQDGKELNNASEKTREKTRSEIRFETLANERREAQIRAERLEGELQAHRRLLEQQERLRQKPTEEEFIDPQERQMREIRANQERTNFQMWDMKDQNEFLLQASSNQMLSKYTKQVEDKLSALRATGINASRMTLAKEMLADDVLAKQSQVPKIKRDAEQRVTEARNKPVGVKTNVSRSKVEDDFEDRLRDLEI